jgi:hypothetical protein
MSMHNPSHPGELLRTWIEGANLSKTQLTDHIRLTHLKRESGAWSILWSSFVSLFFACFTENDL